MISDDLTGLGITRMEDGVAVSEEKKDYVFNILGNKKADLLSQNICKIAQKTACFRQASRQADR